MSPLPSISVHKGLECFTSKQNTVGSCQYKQRSLGHSVSSQHDQVSSLSVPNGLLHSPSDPGLQGHNLFLSRVSENLPHTPVDLLLSKSDLGPLKSSLSAQGSEGPSTSV